MRPYFAIRLLLLAAVMASAAPLWAFPMQPDIKLLIQEAKRPHVKYPVARAGWNGPEERSAASYANPFYDSLRAEPSPAELRQQLLNTALPDWRALFAIALAIFWMRSTRRRTVRPAALLHFPAPPQPLPSTSQAA